MKADNRAWDLEDGSGEIRAHRHRTETELVVPLDGNGCAGPVELTGSTSGITALVGCDGTVAAPKTKMRVRAEADNGPRPAPTRLSGVAEKAPDSRPGAGNIPEDQEIRALVALPVPVEKIAAPASPSPIAPSMPPATLAPASPPKILPAAPSHADLKSAPSTDSVPPPTGEPAPGRLPAPRLDVRAPGTPGLLAGAPAAAGTGAAIPATIGSPGGGLRVVALPALLLGALAAAAYLFARRRKTSVDPQIQILETASLGPKRSLVLARIGDETLILGTSEAGITLLKASSSIGASVWTTSDPVADSAAELGQPIEEALADIPEPGQDHGVPGRAGFRTIAGGLGGLFGGRAVDDRLRNQNHDDTSGEFDELLEDSVEDQELRQKLAAGMSARVR